MSKVIRRLRRLTQIFDSARWGHLALPVLISVLWSLSSGICQAQISYVNTTTPSTNAVTSKGVISIPGILTNAYATANMTNIILGDPLVTAFGKVNADLFFIYNWMLTNDFGGGSGTNTFSGTDTNAVRIISGSAYNLTVTNPLTLFNPTPYYSIACYDPTNLSVLTNYLKGYAYSNSSLTILTNPGGYTLISEFPPTCTNAASPWTLDSTHYAFPLYTNACGFLNLTNNSSTNFLDPYSFATNLVTATCGCSCATLNCYTNDNGFIVFSTGPCPNLNGPYYSAPQYGAGMMTNACGNIFDTSTIISNYTVVLSIDVTNAPAQHYTNLDAAYLIFIGQNKISSNTASILVSGVPDTICGGGSVHCNNLNGTYKFSSDDSNNQYWTNGFRILYYSRGASNFWAWDCCVSPNSFAAPLSPTNGASYSINGGTVTFYTGPNINWSLYQTNAWRFYSSPTVTFSPLPAETINITGLYGLDFSTTNAPVFPLNNTVYYANNGLSVIFNMGLVANPPTLTNVSIVIRPPSPAPPTTSYPPSPGCGHYLIVTIGTNTEYLVNGYQLWETVHAINSGINDGSTITIPDNLQSYLKIDQNGTATLNIINQPPVTVPWMQGGSPATSTMWWSPNIPSDACLPYGNYLNSSFY